MQIVIDIDEKIYNMYDELVNMLSIETSSWAGQIFVNALKNGKSLPKGHGRLIDADEIQFENTEFDTYGDYSRAFDAIDEATTIVEADK